jgi:hypothetical protein
MKNRLKLFTLIFISSAFFNLNSYSQLGGRSSYSFLNLPMSARVESLGGIANSILDNDVTLALQNPAMINSKMHHRIGFTFVNYFSGINMGYLGYARTFKNIGNFHAGLQYVNYGSFKQAEANGDITGTFGASDYAINVGGSREFGKLFSVGVNSKLIVSQMNNFTSVAAAFDLGAAYISKNRRFVTTVVLKNIGTQLSTFDKNNRERLPFELQAGVSTEFDKIPLRFSIVAHNLQQPDLSFIDPSKEGETDITGQPIDQTVSIPTKILSHFVVGAELMPFKRILSLRLGYNFMRRAELRALAKGSTIGLCWGVGIRINRFEVHYSRAAYHLAGSPNTFTLNINLGELPPKPEKKPGKK